MSNEFFKPSHESVSEILGNKNSFYRIPDYQRPYSWESEQVGQLWDDLHEAYKDETENYFLGSIIITPSGQDEGYFDVIDGQQRITTLIILFSVAAASGMLSEIESEVKDAVRANLGDKLRLKLITDITQQNSFQHDIIDNENLKDIKVNKKEGKENKYKNTAVIFSEKIKDKEMEGGNLEKFMRYILRKTTLIKINCTTKSFAIKLFRTLNNRGLDLAQTDLIKSFLLENLDETNHQKVIADWNNINNRIKNETEATMEDLLAYYEYYLLAKNPKKSVSEEIETWIKDNKKSSDIFIYELSQFSKIFIEIAANDTKTYSFNYLPHHIYHWPILTAAKKHLSNCEYEILRCKLVGFYYSYWIAGYTTSKIKQISFNIIGWIKKEKKINEIIDEMDKKIKNDGVVERCFQNFIASDVYGDRWLKPLLIAIEYQQTDDSSPRYIKPDKYLQIEHILPRSNTHHNTYGFGNEHEKYVNKLANLTLLSGKKNIQASNSPFNDKKKVYGGKEREGVTAFIITQKVFNYSEWNKENFKDREKWLLKEIEKFLGIRSFNDIISDESN